MADRSFEALIVEAERRLSYAFGVAYGPEVGAEATADALAYAWEHRDRLAGMDNPYGYLYRVGQSNARRYRRKRPPAVLPPARSSEPWVEPALPEVLAALSRNQRMAVVLVWAYGWTQQEVADLIGVSRTSVQKHLERGMKRLRDRLGVEIDA